MIKELLHKLSTLFQESPDNSLWSMMRFSVFMTITTIVLTWCYLSLKNNAVLDIPSGVVIVIISAFVGKGAQKAIEYYFGKDKEVTTDKETDNNIG